MEHMKRTIKTGAIPEVLKSEVVFSGHFRVVRDRLRLRSGRQTDYDYVASIEAAAVFVIDKGDVILLKQYRHPIKRVTYDLPAGGMEKGETPKQAAARECEEETGLLPTALVLLGSYNHCPGSVNSVVHLFFSDQAARGKLNRDEGEDMELVRVPLRDFWDFIKDKEVEPIVPLGYLVAKEKGLI
jgi:ADP-ribose pyrophosphatase